MAIRDIESFLIYRFLVWLLVRYSEIASFNVWVDVWEKHDTITKGEN